MTVQKHIKVRQGATFKITAPHTDENKVQVLASDVTAARLQARETYESATALVDLDNDAKGGITITDGVITVQMTATQTAALDFETAYYDLEVEYADGMTERLLEGSLILSREVTR